MGVRYNFSENWVNRLSICSTKYMDRKVIKNKWRFCLNVCHDIVIQAFPPIYLRAELQCIYYNLPPRFPMVNKGFSWKNVCRRRRYSPISFQWQDLFQCIFVRCFLGRRERQESQTFLLITEYHHTFLLWKCLKQVHPTPFRTGGKKCSKNS